ncbi:MAG: DUF5999 family protein [Actinoallomurus sp.]
MVTSHPEQGWTLFRNGVVVFDGTANSSSPRHCDGSTAVVRPSARCEEHIDAPYSDQGQAITPHRAARTRPSHTDRPLNAVPNRRRPGFRHSRSDPARR